MKFINGASVPHSSLSLLPSPFTLRGFPFTLNLCHIPGALPPRLHSTSHLVAVIVVIVGIKYIFFLI